MSETNSSFNNKNPTETIEKESALYLLNIVIQLLQEKILTLQGELEKVVSKLKIQQEVFAPFKSHPPGCE
jgi:hypothetical protein